MATPRSFWQVGVSVNADLVKQKQRKTRTISTSDTVTSKVSHKFQQQLNKHQQQASETIVRAINNQTHQTFLLNGVTGSGKTEVYLNTAEVTLEKGGQVLILVPEISLTKQNIDRFTQRLSHRFGDLVVFHSALTPKQRIDAWQRVLQAQAQLVLATRSGIFLPFQHLALIVVDEEHDDSYKQLEGCRYQARDVAVMRAYLAQSVVILGSATPSYESLKNVQLGRYQELVLPERAGVATKPTIRFVDMRKRKDALSDVLLEAIEKRLQKQQQVLLFLNRRGYSPVLWCNACGWSVTCPYCQRSATYHHSKNLIHCHLCDYKARVPYRCQACDSDALISMGVGTEQVENLLRLHFSEAHIARLDRDTTKTKGSLQQILSKAHAQQIDILLGTQMLSKGHDLPKVTLVGILNIDSSLLSPFYKAEEKLMQLLLQVAGRSGRGADAGEVILQTHYPNHVLLQEVFHFGYNHVAQTQLQQRQQANLPPWTELALLRVEALKQSQAQKFAQQCHDYLAAQAYYSVRLTPVVAAGIEKIRLHYRWQFNLIAGNKSALQNLLTSTVSTMQQWQRPRGLRWFIDLTPIEH